MNFCFYASDGQIESVLTAPDEHLAKIQERAYVPCSADVVDTTHYVDLTGAEPVTVEKAPLDATHTVAGLVVSFPSLPEGTHVEVSGQEVIADAAGAEIEFELPGTYTIRLSGLVEYLDETLEVTVG